MKAAELIVQCARCRRPALLPMSLAGRVSCGAAMSHLAIHRLRVGFDADQLVLGFAIRALEGQFATTTLPTALERRRRRRAKLPEFAA